MRYYEIDVNSKSFKTHLEIFKFDSLCFNAQRRGCESVIIKVTSGFWPRVRARALRAPVLFGSFTRPTGRCAPPTCKKLMGEKTDEKELLKSEYDSIIHANSSNDGIADSSAIAVSPDWGVCDRTRRTCEIV